VILDDVIADVRFLVQDETVPYRYSDATLLGLANQALRRVAVLRPDLFSKVSTVATTDDAVIQDAPSDSFRVIEVYSVVGGSAIIEVNRETLDQGTPNWPTATSAEAVNWIRHVRNPNKFFVSPPAITGQSLNIEYAASPPVYDGTTTVALLSDVYFPVVVDATVFLVESIDNENVTSGRAKLFYESYTQALGIAAEGRALTDFESAGIPAQEVI